MPARYPRNTDAQQTAGIHPAPCRSSAGRTSGSPYSETIAVNASELEKMTQCQRTTHNTENKAKKHESQALILDPVFNRESAEEFGVVLPDCANAPQMKEAVRTWGLKAREPIDSREMLSGVARFEILETEEPAVHARAADSQQSLLRAAFSNMAVVFNQRECRVGGALPNSWSRIRSGQVLVRHYLQENN